MPQCHRRVFAVYSQWRYPIYRIDVAFDERLKVRKYKLNLIFLNFNGILRHINWPGKALVQPMKAWLGDNVDIDLLLVTQKNIDLLVVITILVSFLIWCFRESAITMRNIRIYLKGNHLRIKIKISIMDFFSLVFYQFG